jgi:two-component system, OmpR family, response regulator VicR
MSTVPTILYIEDEPMMIDMVTQILRLSGYNCRMQGINSGDEGLAIMRQQRTDVLLLDLTMPNTNGWDIYREMKQDQTLANIPVIVISATVPEQGCHIVDDLPPVEDYITKPFDVDRLLGALREITQPDPAS